MLNNISMSTEELINNCIIAKKNLEIYLFNNFDYVEQDKRLSKDNLYLDRNILYLSAIIK